MLSASLLALLEDKLSLGHTLLQYLDQVAHIDGCGKLVRKVKSELKFLNRLQECSAPKEDHLRSSNMDTLGAICDTMRAQSECSSVLSSFRDPTSDQPLVVDLVLEGGACWCKVIARNPRALQRLSVGQGDYGQRSVVDQARRFCLCAKHNPHLFRAPRICFKFSAGVGRRVFDQLQVFGVEVQGAVIDDEELGVVVGDQPCSEEEEMTDEESSEEDEDSSTDLRTPSSTSFLPSLLPPLADQALNLDVTALLAYVSNLTNGGCWQQFKQPLLVQQSVWERQWPVKDLLDRIFADRRLVCCRSAEAAFTAITSTVGGDCERRRAALLMDRVEVLDDVEPPFSLLLNNTKLKHRAAAIFALGETLCAPTVTANMGFVRAAASQGVRLTVLQHGSRALSEQKESAVLV